MLSHLGVCTWAFSFYGEPTLSWELGQNGYERDTGMTEAKYYRRPDIYALNHGCSAMAHKVDEHVVHLLRERFIGICLISSF